jgi:hypothetical protein
VGVLDRYWLSKSGSKEDVDEEIFEVCRQFLDERVPGDGIDGHGAEHINRKDEEGRELLEQHCAECEYEQLRADAERDDDGSDGIVDSFDDANDCGPA